MNLQKELDDMILVLAWHVVYIDSIVFSECGVIC